MTHFFDVSITLMNAQQDFMSSRLFESYHVLEKFNALQLMCIDTNRITGVLVRRISGLER